MNIAGVDGGTTNTKVVWRAGDKNIEYRSTVYEPIDRIIKDMVRDKVDAIRCMGTTIPKTFPFEILRSKHKDPIKDEMIFQANGARYLANKDTEKKFRNCLVVSIGTGTSYTRVIFGKPFWIPLGNPLGGGFLNGMRSWKNVEWDDLDYMAEKGDVSRTDILIGDVLPDHKMAKLPIANCGRLGVNSTNEDFCKAIVRVVATAAAKDIALYSLLTKKIILVGTTSKLKSLKRELSAYLEIINKTLYTPRRAEFAGAVGAWLG